jgi:hypothetical protein
MNSRTAALLLDALRLAAHRHRNRHLDQAVHRDAIEVGVEHLVRDRVDLEIATSTRVSPAPGSLSAIRVFCPDSECRILSSAFGATWIGSRSLPVAAVDGRPAPAAAPSTARFVLAECIALVLLRVTASI